MAGLTKVPIKKRIMDGFAVLQCNNPEKPRSSLARPEIRPRSEFGVALDFAPNRGGKSLPAPFALYNRDACAAPVPQNSASSSSVPLLVTARYTTLRRHPGAGCRLNRPACIDAHATRARLRPRPAVPRDRRSHAPDSLPALAAFVTAVADVEAAKAGRDLRAIHR